VSINACAALVEAGDPDRFLAAMAAPADVRGRLFVLYALNLEVAKAPFVTKEPMIAEMRLQFWRDVVADAAAGPAAVIAGTTPWMWARRWGLRCGCVQSRT